MKHYIFAPFILFFVMQSKKIYFLYNLSSVIDFLYNLSYVIDEFTTLQLNKKQKMNRQLLVKNLDGFLQKSNIFLQILMIILKNKCHSKIIKLISWGFPCS